MTPSTPPKGRPPDEDSNSPLDVLLSLLGRDPDTIDPDLRNVVFSLVGDEDLEVRLCAHQLAELFPLGDEDVGILETLLLQNGNDIRRSALQLLLRQTDSQALDSARRLLGSPDKPQRLGGLELLRRLIDAGRSVEECRRVAAPWQEREKSLSNQEQKALDSIDH